MSSTVSNFELAADAIVTGDVATLKRLLREEPELIRSRSTREHRAMLLHYISANGVEGYRQKTPRNAVEIAEILLRAGADVNAEAEMYGGGATTLGLVATSIHPERAGVQDALISVLQISDDGNHIRHVVAPSLPESYVKAIDGLPIGPKHGSCGTAMFRGKPVVVSDIFTDPLWEDYREYAAAAGVQACWSTPIMSSKGKVLGSFAMYYRKPRTPTGEESRLTNVATQLAGQAIEHHASHEHHV